VETRLRVGGTWTPSDTFSLRLQFDALSGLAGGPLSRVGTTRGSDTLLYPLDRSFGAGVFLPRLLYLTVRLPFGQLRLGQQAFSWGLGLLANDGEGEPDFGDRRSGSLVERLAFATRPASDSENPLLRALTVFVAADLVFQDPNADLLRGDLALSAVVGARTETGPLSLGVFESVRRQVDRPDQYRPTPERSVSFVSTTDVWASAEVAQLGAGRTVRVEGELAIIAGQSTRPFSEESLAGAGVLSGGGLLRARYDDRALRLSARLDAGYASGDNDLRDATARAFSFHPDAKAGFILFDQVLNRASARATDRLASPELLGVPPASLRFLATNGAIVNAAFLNPVVRFRPLDTLELRLGYLLAASAADFVDPYTTAVRGGYNTNYAGALPGSPLLGHEVDLALRWRLPMPGATALRLGADGGVLLPGAALAGLASAPILAGRVLADVEF
jgi:hypothetical protein